MVSRPSLETATASDPDRFVEPLELGKRVKEIRLAKGWTLEEVGKRTGIARSTLSKIENDQVSPSFTIVQKLIKGLEMDLPQLFVEASEHSIAGRRDITRKGKGEPHPTATYEHELLNYSISRKKMVPPQETIYTAEKGYKGAHYDHFGNWFRAIRTGGSVVEDPLFGFRACAPALLCNDSYTKGTFMNWDPEKLSVI